MNKFFKSLSFWVLAAGVLGYISAIIFGNPDWVSQSHPPFFYELIILIKSSFLSALKMMIAPIIFFSLIGGIINIGEITKLKSMGMVTVSYYISTTIIAIAIGLTAVFFVHPWENSGLKIKNSKPDQSLAYKKPSKLISGDSQSVTQVVTTILNKAFANPFESLVRGNIIGIVTAALLIGLALLVVHSNDSPIYQLVSDINIVINKVLDWIIKLTPFGIFAIAFDFKLKVGSGLLGQLLSFASVVFVATLIHGMIILPLIGWIFGGVKPFELFKKSMKPLFVALSTSSSSATLPITMKTSEDEFKVSKGVSGFVFPLGATMNMDGTALYEGIAAVFLAYLYDVPLSAVATFSIFFMSMLSSVGAPGMPSASMAGMQMVLLAAGIPLEAIGILLVIDKPLDTFRTAVNVQGDIVGAIVTQNYVNKKSNT